MPCKLKGFDSISKSNYYDVHFRTTNLAAFCSLEKRRQGWGQKLQRSWEEVAWTQVGWREGNELRIGL